MLCQRQTRKKSYSKVDLLFRNLFLPSNTHSSTGRQALPGCPPSVDRIFNFHRFTYRSEWLGYLPFGQYAWFEVHGEDFTREFPDGWGKSDVDALERAGCLRRVSQWHNPQDKDEVKVVYELCR